MNVKKHIEEKLQRDREANHKWLLNTENKLRVDGGGGEGKVGDGHWGGHLLDEHWVLYGNPFDNKLYLKNPYWQPLLASVVYLYLL